MEEVSAFAAYQAASKKVTQNKSPKDKKSKNPKGRPQFLVPTAKAPTAKETKKVDKTVGFVEILFESTKIIVRHYLNE